MLYYLLPLPLTEQLLMGNFACLVGLAYVQ